MDEIINSVANGHLCFGTVLTGLKKSVPKVYEHAARRSGWNGTGMLIRIQKHDEQSYMTQPYLYIEYSENHPVHPGLRMPWVPSQGDVMAEDWELVCICGTTTNGC